MIRGEIDLLVFGDTAIDYFYEVNRFPKLNEASEVRSVREFYGGMGANTVMVANSLGLKTALFSVIGSDAEDYRKYLQSHGVRLCLTGIFGDTTKSIFFKNDGNQISFFYKGVTEKLDELEPDRDIISEAKCVYMARTYLALQRKVARLCKNKLLFYNPGYGVFKFNEIPEEFYAILKKTTVLIMNHHEMQHLKSLGFKVDFRLGPKAFLVTKGKDGCSVYYRNSQIDVAAYPVKMVDESGAGDAFNAGFIAAYLKGFDLIESVKIGNATASFIVEEWGCQTNLPDWGRVMERVGRIK